MLVVLLEYIDLFNLNGNMKQTFAIGRGYPALYHSTLLYFILSTAIITKLILLKFAPIIYASILLFCFCTWVPSQYSNDYVSKINAFLTKSNYNDQLMQFMIMISYSILNMYYILIIYPHEQYLKYDLEYDKQ